MTQLPQGGLTRLAPTPSGLLHAGNAINFLIARHLADATGAALLLRIDDLDAERVRTAYLVDIFRSLEWLDIRWDLGPRNVQDHLRNWSQQLRLARYGEVVDALRRSGLLYACTCSRSQLRRSGGDARYPGTCRERAVPLDTPDTSWRLRLPDQAPVTVAGLDGSTTTVDLAQAMGDPVVRQRNGRPAYQVASMVDDVDRGTTFIVRGMDLLPSTACQLHLATVLGAEGFLHVRFLHHPLIAGADGQKLSKSAGAASLQAMREAGLSPDGLKAQARTMVHALMGSQ